MRRTSHHGCAEAWHALSEHGELTETRGGWTRVKTEKYKHGVDLTGIEKVNSSKFQAQKVKRRGSSIAVWRRGEKSKKRSNPNPAGEQHKRDLASFTAATLRIITNFTSRRRGRGSVSSSSSSLSAVVLVRLF